MAAFAIGLTLVLIHLAGIPISGASVNPARSFGPAIFAQGVALQQLWLYLTAPVVGGVAAALLWNGLFASEFKGKGSKEISIGVAENTPPSN
jgi:aquaporin Z